jgi:hypothetical protein
MTKKKKFKIPLEDLGTRVPGLTADRSGLERKKLIMLCMHYNLEQLDYRELSLALAREFIDGFKEVTPKGRRIKWTEYILGILFVEVERKRIARGLRKGKIDPHIYNDIAQEEPWNSFLEKVDGINIIPDPAEAIRQAYFKAKRKNWRHIVWKSYCYHVEMDTVDEWGKIVLSDVQNPSLNEIKGT